MPGEAVLPEKPESISVQERLDLLLRRLIPTDRQRLLALTILSGALCGLVAVSFHLAIGKAESLFIDRALAAPHFAWVYWCILTPALGGLIVGLALKYLVPGAVGSGVPQVKVAYALHAGYVPMRDAIGKFVLCVVQLGTGASSGREGPTVQICAAISNLLARGASLSRQSQRRMAAVGVAAGIAAAFNAPISAVTFTLEEVIGDLDQTMLSGVIVAAAIAAAVERSILGQHPVFEVLRPYTVVAASSLLWYAVLGLLSAFVAVGFTDSLLTIRLGFKRTTKLPKWTHPMFGGLFTGTLAVLALTRIHHNGITGAGYATLALALAGSLPVKALLTLCLMKFVATAFSYGSGSVGGIFAPSLFIGGMLGGAVGYVDMNVFHHPADSVGAFALVGMGAVFAGIIRAPMTSVLIIFEMTGSYGLVLPLMIANMGAYALARHWRPIPVYEALLEQDGVYLPHGKPVIPDQDTQEFPGEVPP